MKKSKATQDEIAILVASFLFNTHRYHKAIDLVKELLILWKSRKENHNKMMLCCLHLYLAAAFHWIENLNEALANYKNVLKLSQEIGLRALDELAYQGISNVYICLEQQVQVIFYERKLLGIAKETGEKQKEVRAYATIGHAYSVLGRHDESIDFQNKALRLSIEIGDREWESRVLSCLGSVFKKLAQHDKAVIHLEKALQIRREIGDQKNVGKLHQQLGDTYYELRSFEKALDCHTKSLQIMTTFGEQFEQAICYNKIGNTYLAIDRYSEALEHFAKSLDTITKFGEKEQQGRAHSNVGLCHWQLGQYKHSLQHTVKALEIQEEIGDRYGEATSCRILGSIYFETGQYNQAFRFLERTLKIGKETGDREAELKAYCDLGKVYFHFDTQSVLGEKCFKKALEISKEMGAKREMAVSYMNLAMIYLSRQQYKESLENHKCTVEIMKEIGDRRGELLASTYLAYVYRALGNSTEVEEHLQKGLHIIREIGDTGREYAILLPLGSCSADDGKFEKARDYLSESIICIERDRQRLEDEHQISHDNLTFRNYATLCTILIIIGKVPEALCTAERGRARALVDLMSKRYGIHVKCSSGETNVNELKRLPILNKSTIIFMAVPRNIYFWVVEEEREIRFRLLCCESQEESITNLLKLPREQLLRSFLGRGVQCEDRSLSAYYRVQTKTGESNGLRLVKQENDHSEDKTGTQELGALHLLYNELFAPVADLIQRQDIIIVPEGDMWMVPFPALKDADGKFLSETYRIRLIPSLTALKLIQDSPYDYHRQTGALVVGDPDVHPTTRLRPLPEARKEAEEIADLLGVIATVGSQATKDEVLRRIQEVSLIHIAAHGDAERGEIALSPNRSSLQVPRKVDFMLTMEDVAKVGIRAKLVVLSCCHSGRGEIMQSEGVVGISRAFLASGARSVLVSLWALDDRSTKEFMIRFYGHLVRDKMSSSQAVHQSMKWMRESTDYNSVGDWAPFVLIGDDVKLNF